MSRIDTIKEIEHKRDSRVVTYVTSDRQGPINARVAMDIIPIISEQLRSIGKTKNIDLFLYTAGGDTMVPWRLVSMIREYCEKFSVIIPYKAHSAGTMIALGADEIVMSDLSEVSPIDPSTANAFNPTDPENSQNKIPISVEDVIAYFDLAKNKFGIKNDEDLTKIFSKFVEASPQIHPLALGNVNRTHNLIRLIAKRLLKSHVYQMRDEEIEKIVEYFTEKLYSHQYFIGRKEAKEELGLSFVVNADADLSKLMSDLYMEYAKEMDLQNNAWNPENELGIHTSQNTKTYTIASMESTVLQKHFKITMEFQRQQLMVTQQTPQGAVQVPQQQVGMRPVEQGWR